MFPSTSNAEKEYTEEGECDGEQSAEADKGSQENIGHPVLHAWCLKAELIMNGIADWDQISLQIYNLRSI